MNGPDALLDTSVLVRALVAGLPVHAKARSYLDRARQGDATCHSSALTSAHFTRRDPTVGKPLCSPL